MLLTAMLLLPSPAHAVTFDLGLGWRRSSDAFDGQPMGLRAMGRIEFAEHFAAEVGVYGRFPGNPMSSLTQTLVAIAYEGNNETSFRQPINREAASVSALFEASPWARSTDEGVTTWVYGVAGLDARLVVRDYASVNPDYAAGVEGESPAIPTTSPTAGLVVGPALGVAFDTWFDDRIGVRAMAVERFAIEEEPDYGNRLANGAPEPLERVVTTSLTLSIDLMVAF